MKKWIYIRGGLIATAAFMALWQGPLSTHAKPPIRPADLIIGLAFGVFGLQFVLGIQAANRSSASFWKQPSWRENPFSFKQPVQFFHFGGWLFIISSLISSGLTAFYKTEYINDALMPLCVGIGVLGGVYLSTIIFRKKFKVD